MRRGGRAIGGSTLLYLYTCVALVGTVEYGVPVEIKLWDTGRTPLAHMVDVTNGFGLKVLAEHNFLNDNNIAFSPYGLMGIMVALYEGVDGESSYQIQRGMQLPWNRNVMRIGFRDIHRTLKTYFVPEEGFLAGLALNNENVTFNDSYKKTLRFYGFDLENDQLPKLPSSNDTTNGTTSGPTTPATPAGNTESMTTAAMTPEAKSTESTTVSIKEETTLNPNAETISVDVRAPTEATTASPSLAPNAESTTMMPVIKEDTASVATETTVQTTTEATVTTTIVSTTTTDSPTTTTAAPTTTITAASTTNAATTTTTVAPTTVEPAAPVEDELMTTASLSADTDSETIAQQTSQATSALTVDPTTNNEVATTAAIGTEPAASTSQETTTGVNDMTDNTMMTGTTISDPSTDGSTTAGDMTTSADSSTTAVASSLETLTRRKKSIVDFIFTNPPYIDDYFFYRSYHVGPDVPGPGFDDKMFLANGLKSVQVTYMHYETVLEHAYLPHLEASALRLPLDSERYYLLVVLPNRGGSAELGRLLARMARESDLADVYAALRPRRVRAVVPSFIVKGHVTLTTDLQKLGIRDVFEPRQRDFTAMTPQAGVYVRSIEQAVSVAIRKYRLDDHKKNRYVTNRDPVTFSATYPFLYFVMDATIHVALMAGKMVDPLNSRIL